MERILKGKSNKRCNAHDFKSFKFASLEKTTWLGRTKEGGRRLTS